MTVRDVKDVLGARVLAGEEFLNREVKSACGSDMMSDVLAFSKDHSVLLTGLCNPQVIRGNCKIHQLSPVTRIIQLQILFCHVAHGLFCYLHDFITQPCLKNPYLFSQLPVIIHISQLISSRLQGAPIPQTSLLPQLCEGP